MRYRYSIVTLVLLGLTLLVGTASAQEAREISGQVTSADDQAPLPGANVSVPGRTIGTAADANGRYSLRVPVGVDSLRFSFVGFAPRTVAIAGRTTINVSLRPSQQQLGELVVVGYGEQQQRDVTGVVQQVSSEDLNQAASISPDQALAGKVAGVQISSSSGAPGSQSFIRIRGATSVNADSQPLFVIDGVPISNEPNTAGRNPLNFLNPNDIANITVLKDASATAIYGARGANGVIMIETKQADSEDPRITYTGSLSSSRITDQIDVLGADQFREVVRERAPSNTGMLGKAETDWQDVVQRPGVGQEHTLGFSRMYEDSEIRLSLGYLNQEGILETSSTERVSASLNYNQQLLDDNLSVSTRLKGSHTEDHFAPGALVGSAVSFAPTQPVRDVDSPYGGFFEWEPQLAENNPAASFILEDNVGENYRSLGRIEGDYQIPFVEGLSARVNVGYDVTMGEREFFAPSKLKAQAESPNPGTITRASFTRLNTLLDAYMSYDRDFESISSSFDVTAGYSYQEFHEEYPEFTADSLTTDIFGPNNTSPATNFTTFVTEIPNRLISGFARVNYKFMDRYLLTFTVRRDGSSRFGPKNRWGTFPSGALAWRVHNEPFMEDFSDVVSSLKVRASWGVTGNQEIGDFLYKPLWVPGGPKAQVQFGNEFVSTVRPNAADEALKWEETTSTNIGIDYGLYEGRITGSIEYYRKDTDDLLFTVPVAGGANLSNRVLTNIGSMKNQGLEFSIDAEVANTDEFSYNASFNASTNSNELVKLNRGDDADFQGIDTGGISGGVGNTIQILREGHPVNSFFVYRHKMDSNGNPIYEDTNGDGVIDRQDLYKDVAGGGENGNQPDGTITEADRVVAGSPQPDWILGHTSQFTYQNFDASFTLRAHLGQQVYNNVASNYGHFNHLRSQVPSNIHASALETGFETPQYFSDYYVEDAGFLRMDNISLGYTVRSLPSIERARIYGRISNVFVLTGYSGQDPEVGGPGSSGIGIDNNVYPRSRTFTAGLSITI